ncbi:MAG: hypothetical protein NT007_07965 [Candidatus Kapabacteria bacterium]|nr:hypothetical protein [Candidatus Kapabacteria bacterium]
MITFQTKFYEIPKSHRIRSLMNRVRYFSYLSSTFILLLFLFTLNVPLYSQNQNCPLCSNIVASHIQQLNIMSNCTLQVGYDIAQCPLNSSYYYEIRITTINNFSGCNNLSVNELFNMILVNFIISDPCGLKTSVINNGKIRIQFPTCWNFNSQKTSLLSCTTDCCILALDFTQGTGCPLKYSLEPLDKPCISCDNSCFNVCNSNFFEKFNEYFKTTTTPDNDCTDFKVDAGKDISICAYPNVVNTVQLSASGGDTYSWSPSSNLDATNIPNPTFTLPNGVNSGDYTYTVTAHRGNCTVSDEVRIHVKSSMDFTLNSDVTICEGQSVQLNAAPITDYGTIYYHWSGTGLNKTNISNPVAKPNVTTIYTVYITGGNCMSVTKQVTVNVTPKPALIHLQSVSICPGKCVTLNPLQTGTNPSDYEYSWSPSTGLDHLDIFNPKACPKAPTCYTVTVKNINTQCQDTCKICVSIIGYNSKKAFFSSIPTQSFSGGDTVPVQFTVVSDTSFLPINQFQISFKIDTSKIKIIKDSTELTAGSRGINKINGFDNWNFILQDSLNGNISVFGIGSPITSQCTFSLKFKIIDLINWANEPNPNIGISYLPNMLWCDPYGSAAALPFDVIYIPLRTE